MSRAPSVLVAALLAALAGAGCGGESTGVLVRIEPEDTALGKQIDELRVLAVGRDAAGEPRPTDPAAKPYELTALTPRWPQSVAILAGPESTAGVEVLVLGMADGIEVARGGAAVGFTRGAMASATVTLRAACRGVYCDGAAFCGAGGRCEAEARRLDFAVNASGAGDQTHPVVAAIGQTGWVVAWVDGAGSPAQVSLRRLQLDGSPRDLTDAAAEASSAAQAGPALAVAPGADPFVVAWAEGDSGRVRVRRFSAASLEPLDPASEEAAGGTVGTQIGAALGANPQGFLVAWQDSQAAGGGPGSSIRYRRGRWDAGWIDGAAAYAATSPTGAEQLPAACGSCGGSETFLVAWQDASMADPDPSGIQIRGRWLQGTPPTGGESVLDTTTTGDQVNAAAASGGAMGMVVWEDQGAPQAAVRGRICTPGSSYLTPELTIADANVTPARPAVGVASDVALIVWEAEPEDAPGTLVVLGRRFHLTGAPLDDAPFRVAATRSGNQQEPRVAGSATGFAIVWQEYDPGAGWEIRGRLLGAAEGP